MTPAKIPDVRFHSRVRNDALGGANPFEWKIITSQDVFAGRRILLFALPGAFTPACSDSHQPGYERRYDDFRQLGIDRVVCRAVNDAFVMFQWAKSRDIAKVFMLPDGNADFTRRTGMLVDRSSTGMAMRRWRYSMLARDGMIEKLFAVPNVRDNPGGADRGHRVRRGDHVRLAAGRKMGGVKFPLWDIEPNTSRVTAEDSMTDL